MIKKLDNGKVVLQIQKCLRCRNLAELFKAPIEDQSPENLLYRLYQKDKIKLKFLEFIVLCPSCGDKTEGSTFHKMSEEELEIWNNTDINDLLVTVI